MMDLLNLFIQETLSKCFITRRTGKQHQNLKTTVAQGYQFHVTTFLCYHFSYFHNSGLIKLWDAWIRSSFKTQKSNKIIRMRGAISCLSNGSSPCAMDLPLPKWNEKLDKFDWQHTCILAFNASQLETFIFENKDNYEKNLIQLTVFLTFSQKIYTLEALLISKDETSNLWLFLPLQHSH